jgi:hypothetical protein
MRIFAWNIGAKLGAERTAFIGAALPFFLGGPGRLACPDGRAEVTDWLGNSNQADVRIFIEWVPEFEEGGSQGDIGRLMRGPYNAWRKGPGREHFNHNGLGKGISMVLGPHLLPPTAIGRECSRGGQALWLKVSLPSSGGPWCIYAVRLPHEDSNSACLQRLLEVKLPNVAPRCTWPVNQ